MITAGSLMVGTPINLVRGLIRLGLIEVLNVWSSQTVTFSIIRFNCNIIWK